jgi:hypothetical protein
MVKSKVAAEAVPVFVMDALPPAGPVVTVPIAIVPAGPVGASPNVVAFHTPGSPTNVYVFPLAECVSPLLGLAGKFSLPI